MIKRTLYPETSRIPEKTDNAIITEKMDGAKRMGQGTLGMV